MIAAPRSILVYVGLDLVGDGVMKLPFVSALRALYPSAHITWLAGQGRTVFKGVLAGLTTGLLDEVIEDAGIGVAWPEMLRRPLPGRAFDLVIDSQRRVMTTLILRRIRHQRFISATADWRLSDAQPPSGRQKRPSMLGQMMALLEASSGAPPLLPPPLQLAPALLAEAERRLPSGRDYVGLAPGAGGKHKCWPLDNYLRLAESLIEAGRQPVFFLGPAERDWQDLIAARIPTALMPLTDDDLPPLTIALATRLSVAIANDCGTGHMLAAGGVALLSLFGPTAPEKFAPAASSSRVIRAQDHGGDAMSFIPLDAVRAAVAELSTLSRT